MHWKRWLIVIGWFEFFLNGICIASLDSNFVFSRGKIVPLSRYVRLGLGEKVLPSEKRIVLNKEEVQKLKVVFLRDSLQPNDGPQFLKLTFGVTHRTGVVLEENEQYAITFSRLSDSTKELELLQEYVSRVNPMGWFNPESIEWIPIQVDTLSPWGEVIIRIETEKDIMKYYGRIRNKLEYRILVQGPRIQPALTLSVPKVLFDSCRDDSVNYGNTSAMLRFFLLNPNTGEKYPMSFGIGTFGVDSPIDVSRAGGGFAISFYFDVVQMLGSLTGRFSQKINAGVDVAPFFPIGHKSRILVSARVGISP